MYVCILICVITFFILKDPQSINRVNSESGNKLGTRKRIFVTLYLRLCFSFFYNEHVKLVVLSIFKIRYYIPTPVVA